MATTPLVSEFWAMRALKAIGANPFSKESGLSCPNHNLYDAVPHASVAVIFSERRHSDRRRGGPGRSSCCSSTSASVRACGQSEPASARSTSAAGPVAAC
jgi:hypothetical protein